MVVLQVLHVLDGHLNDLGLLNAAAAFLHVVGRYEPREIRQTVVHAVSPPLLYDPVRHGVLLTQT